MNNHKSFNARLRKTQQKSNSLLCVGLDTDVSRMPAILRGKRNAALDFNRRIIDATHDLVCSYKLNLAFYEALGESGWKILEKTLAYIPRHIISIGDAKRGDVGNTAQMYAKALFVELTFDACTVSPYMGGDSVEPFLGNKAKGVFVLAVTSNHGSMDFQQLKIKGSPLYEYVVRCATQWNAHGNCGLVVGATHPRQLNRVRAIAPDLPLLIPGIGAQGGDLKAAIKHGCDKSGLMAVINASRSIIYADSGKDFAKAARTAALHLRNDINAYRELFFS